MDRVTESLTGDHSESRMLSLDRYFVGDVSPNIVIK